MPRFNRIATPIPDLVVIERQRFGDERGFFSRFFCREELADFGASGTIARLTTR